MYRQKLRVAIDVHHRLQSDRAVVLSHTITIENLCFLFRFFLPTRLSSPNQLKVVKTKQYTKQSVELYLTSINKCLSLTLLPSLDCFLFRRLRRTLRQICGRLVGLPGPNRRENRSTLSGRKSGKSSRTSTFAYFDGNIAANGVSSFFSPPLSSSSDLSPNSDLPDSVL